MTTKVKAVVLKAADYKEKDKILTLFSLEQGKISVVMRGVKGEKAKLKIAKEPFCFGEYIIENTKGNNVVTSAMVVDNFFELTQNLDKLYEGCAILDVTNQLSGPVADSALFIELLKALKTLARQQVKKYYVFDKFLINLLRQSGCYVLQNKCSSCGYDLDDNRYFNLDTGEFVCANCKNNLCEKVSNACFAALRLLQQTEYERLENLKLGGGAEMEVYSLLAKDFEWRFGKRFVQIL